ncbi:MAG: hypothetical protein ACT4OY_08215 [Alphaproteobacteria bacterium]
MTYLIRDVTPGSFTPSKRSRRQDDEHGGGDFARWMSGNELANDEVPKRPLQRPMTSIEDMLLLARAREQIENAALRSPISAYAHTEEIETSTEDAAQYAFDFMSSAARIDQRI